MLQLIILMLASPYIITSYCRDTSLIIIGFHAYVMRFFTCGRWLYLLNGKLRSSIFWYVVVNLFQFFVLRPKIVENYFVVRETLLN